MKDIKEPEKQENIKKVDETQIQIEKPIDAYQFITNLSEKQINTMLDALPYQSFFTIDDIKDSLNRRYNADKKFKEQIDKQLLSKRSKYIDFTDDSVKRMEFKGRGYGIVCRSDAWQRIAPFYRLQDKMTGQSWCYFFDHHFFGKKLAPYDILGRSVKKIVVMPLDLSKYSIATAGKGIGGFFDEFSLMQLPIYKKDTDEALNQRIEDGRFVSQFIALGTMLASLKKSKYDWTFIIILVGVVMLMAIVGYLLLNPHLLSGLTNIVRLPTLGLHP